MSEKILITTTTRAETVEITGKIREIVKKSGVADGMCTLFVPHTTAGIMLNENEDQKVCADIIATIEKMVPADPAHTHKEGNSHAHIKALLTGQSISIFISEGKLELGSWQGIFFVEYDGPRIREVWVKVFGDRR